jgi:hypothetical protein
MPVFDASWRKDHGASSTIDQLELLGHAFKEQTAKKWAGVGGREEIAVITKDKFELKGLEDLPDIKLPQPFVLIPCRPGSDFPIHTPLPLPRVPWVFQHCDFVPTGVERFVDGSIFLKCKFRDATLIYLGGDAVFGPDNIVEGNSRLSLGPDACRRPDIANELAKRFDIFHGGSRSPLPGDTVEATPYYGPEHSPPAANTTRTPN